MGAKVLVKLEGQLRRLAGAREIEVEIEEGADVRSLAMKLGELLGEGFLNAIYDREIGDVKPKALLLVNGVEVSALSGADTKLKGGDVVTIIPIHYVG